MKKIIITFLLFLCSVFLIGCTESYQDDDIAAIVRGEEITVGELRFLFPDDKILDILDGAIKAKLAAQEVKKLNIDLSEKLQEIEENKKLFINYPPKDVDTEWAKRTREFAETQAKKFGMEPKEFYEKHMEKSQEISMNVVAYIEEKIGSPNVEESTEYTERANRLLDKLVEDNEDEIEILIK